MELRRALAVLTLAALALLGTATPALAHAELKSSDPAQGTSLATVPKQLVLTFSEPVSPIQITVAGSPGPQWTLGQTAVEGPVVTVPVQAAAGPAGPYTITWKVKSGDGDDVTGTINFTLTVPAATTTTTTTQAPATTATTPVPTNTAAPAGDDGGVPPWLWVLIGIAVLLIVAVLLTRRRVQAKSETTERQSSADPGGVQ